MEYYTTPQNQIRFCHIFVAIVRKDLAIKRYHTQTLQRNKIVPMTLLAGLETVFRLRIQENGMESQRNHRK